MDTVPHHASNGNRLERFLSFIQVKDTGYDTPCWLWTGFINPKGYGIFGFGNNRSGGAHRWSYEYFVGPIPEGLQIDHLCRVRNCANPEHIEPVTPHINALRGAKGILRPNKSSRYPGVRKYEKGDWWQAFMTIGHQFIHIGHFHTEEEAYQAYVDARTAFERDGTLPQTKAPQHVTWHKRRQVWQATMQHDGKGVYLGSYDTKEEAILAYETARREIDL